jgi:DNA-binding CsgD family transcriptional regulator
MTHLDRTGMSVAPPRVMCASRPVSIYRASPEAGQQLIAPRLSAREVEVLLTWLGTDSKGQAAKALYLSTATVSTHLTRIRAKYAAVGRPAGSKTKLLVRAIQDGITTIDAW